MLLYDYFLNLSFKALFLEISLIELNYSDNRKLLIILVDFLSVFTKK